MLGVMLLVTIAGVSAEQLFYDNFDTPYTHTSGSALYSELNTVNGWSIVDAGQQDDVLRVLYGSSTTDYVLKIKDDAEAIASFSTLGKQNIHLEYARITNMYQGSNDRLRVYWRVGSSGTWTSLESIGYDDDDHHASFNLVGAQDKSEIQVRFFYDDGSQGYAIIDEVVVTGDATQETCTNCEISLDDLSGFYSTAQEDLMIDWTASGDCTPNWNMISDEDLKFYAEFERRKNAINNSGLNDENKKICLDKIDLERKLYELYKKHISLLKKESSILDNLIKTNKECIRNTKIIDESLKEYIRFKKGEIIDKYFLEKSFKNFSYN